jgi:hypothetical protein
MNLNKQKIGGHRDDIGIHEFNVELSQKRAETIINIQRFGSQLQSAISQRIWRISTSRIQ